jgi:hypothetical protein
MSVYDIGRSARIRIGCIGRDRKEHFMPRVYHKGAAGIALPMAGAGPEARAVHGRPINPLCFDPVEAGMRLTITIMLVREEL